MISFLLAAWLQFSPGDSVPVVVSWPEISQAPTEMVLDSTRLWLEEWPAAGIPDTIDQRFVLTNGGVDTLAAFRPPEGDSVVVMGCYQPYMSPDGPHPTPECSQNTITFYSPGFPTIAAGVVIDTLGQEVAVMALREGHLYFDGTASNEWSIASTAVLQIADNLRYRVHVTRAGDGTSRHLGGRYNATGDNRQWYLRDTSTNVLQFTFSEDGTSGTVVSATSSAHGVAAGAEIWYEAEFVNGVVTFRKSTDGVSFSDISTDSAHSGKNIYAAGTAAFRTTPGATGSPWIGKFYRAQLFDDDVAVVDLQPDAATSQFQDEANSLTVTMTGNSWTFVPTWNPGNYPEINNHIDKLLVFVFAGDGNRDYGLNSINPWANLGNTPRHGQRGVGSGSGTDDPTFNDGGGGVLDYYSLDGGDHFEFAAHADFGIGATGHRTIIAKVRTSVANTGSDAYVSTANLAAADPGVNLYSSGATVRNVRLTAQDGVGIPNVGAGTPELVSSTTHVIAGVRDGTSGTKRLRTYLDGTEISTSPAADTTSAALGASVMMRLGRFVNSSGGHFTGDFFWVIVIDDKLTQAEIQAITTDMENFEVGAVADDDDPVQLNLSSEFLAKTLVSSSLWHLLSGT